MPENSYTNFGTFLWLAYPTYALANCLLLSWANQPMHAVTRFTLQFLNYGLFVPTVLYAWCEAAYGCHILTNWREPPRNSKKK